MYNIRPHSGCILLDRTISRGSYLLIAVIRAAVQWQVKRVVGKTVVGKTVVGKTVVGKKLYCIKKGSTLIGLTPLKKAATYSPTGLLQYHRRK